VQHFVYGKTSNQSMKTLFYNLLIFGIGLIGVELFFGAWIFDRHVLDNLGIAQNVQHIRDVQDLYPSSKKLLTYTRDAWGFRGASIHNQPHKIDIITIGGSTTDQKFVDDAFTWDAVLSNKLQQAGKTYHIANAGVTGQSTYGHLKNFELWFPRVPNLKPKYILFYIGINDFYLSADTSRFDYLKEDEYWKNPDSRVALRYYVSRYSATFNLYKKIKTSIMAYRYGLGNSKIRVDTSAFTTQGYLKNSFFTKIHQKDLDRFKERVQQLALETEKMGAEPIFITQPALYYRYINGKLHGLKRLEKAQNLRFNGIDYFKMLQGINRQIRAVAKDQYTVVELTSLPIWTFEDFYDMIHMTPKGTQKVGTILFEQLKNKLIPQKTGDTKSQQ
jgi:lysophospholipase L1-like esterase